jgi:hypothetical protein
VAAVAGPVTENASTKSVEVPVAASATVRGRSAAIETPPLTSDYSDQVLLLGRLRPGMVGESRRVVHVFLLALDIPRDTTLTARCGETLAVGDMQWLSEIAGMPCERCLLHTLAQR